MGPGNSLGACGAWRTHPLGRLGSDVGVCPILAFRPPLWSTFFVPNQQKSPSRNLLSLPGGSRRLRTPPDGSVRPLGRPGKHEIGYEQGRELTKRAETLPG